jgi:GNAT superfamily N-acetyltransferase
LTAPSITIRPAETPEDLARCFPVMRELRPHVDAAAFAAQVEVQRRDEGYTLAMVEVDGVVAVVAGYRVMTTLAWGRAMYVDDLVTAETYRSRGLGGRLLQWLMQRARELGCGQFHLDSGTQRRDAHRFYHAQGMTISSFHFAVPHEGGDR